MNEMPENAAEWPEMICMTGMPGPYETAVREMTVAGVLWLRERSGLSPCRDTDRRLEDVCSARHPDCSGAMATLARRAARHIWKFGWLAFVELARK